MMRNPNLRMAILGEFALVMPSEQNVEQLDDDEAFMENLKLRHIASNFDDFARKLQHRFDDLPVPHLWNAPRRSGYSKFQSIKKEEFEKNKECNSSVKSSSPGLERLHRY
jgi:hypothetical protein